MKLTKLIICCLALLSLLSLGCAKDNSNLGEAKLTIPTYIIKAPAKGKILGLILEEGEHIGKDQPLFAIASDEVDQKAKQAAESLAKAEAELKRMEVASTIKISEADLANAKADLDKAQAKADKMQRLLSLGGVSRKQAQQAEAELAGARAAYQAASTRGASLKASPEDIAKQKENISVLKEVNKKALTDQAAFESHSPNSCVVIQKLAKNGELVEKDQVVLKLLAQGECELKIPLTQEAKQKLGNFKGELIFKEKASNNAFLGKVLKVEDKYFTALVKLPANIKNNTPVNISLKSE